jgi:hypothetical protein
MTEITVDEYKAFIDRDVATAWERTLVFAMATITVDSKGEEVCLVDNNTLTYYRADGITLMQIGKALDDLVRIGLYLKEGFVDRSLNTEVYARIDKFKMTYQHLEFTYKEMSELHFLIFKLRFKTNPFTA